MQTLPPLIGKYEVLGRLPQGGMGTVYLGRDPVLRRSVAIKVIRTDIDSPALRERFEEEEIAVARLRHPNIVTVFDYGEFQAQPYLVMEYIQGESLRDLIARRAPLALPDKLRLMDEVCAGVARAHQARLIHRDLKPENVMVDRENQLAKILDFGVARSLEASRSQFTQGIGTLSYMAPEQVTTGIVDGRTDIFALGAVFYELLSYRQAFGGATPGIILRKILEEQPIPLSQLDPALDSAIDQMLRKALAKDPLHRYQDVDALRRDLKSIVAITAVVNSRHDPHGHQAGRNQSDSRSLPRAAISRTNSFFAGAIVAVVLVAVTWGGYLMHGRIGSEASPAEAYVLEAAKHLDQNSVDLAVGEARTAVFLEPSLASAHDVLSAALSSKGDKDGAIAAARDATRLAPLEPRYWNRLASLLTWKDDWNGVADAAVRAITLDPPSPRLTTRSDWHSKRWQERNRRWTPIVGLQSSIRSTEQTTQDSQIGADEPPPAPGLLEVDGALHSYQRRGRAMAVLILGSRTRTRPISGRASGGQACMSVGRA
jgi:serine/threonine protein kinase